MTRRPARPFLVLAAIVLAAHWLALRALPERVRIAERAAPHAFVTRGIDMPAQQPDRVAPPPAVESPPTERRVQPKTPAQVLANATPRAERAPESDVVLAVAQPETATPPTAFAAAAPEPTTRHHNAQAARFVIPGSMRLHYKVTAQVRGRNWNGQGELAWRHDGDSYEAQLEVMALLLPTRRQRSAGRITAEGLAPLRFSDKVRSEEAAHFQRDKGKVTFSTNQPDAPLMPGAQDRLSVMLQLGAMIAGQPQKFPPGTTISVQTASTHDAEPWLFTVEAEEELQLPGGNVRAIKLTRNPRREFDQKVELWLAPGLDYVPVRVRLTQPNGDSVDQQWSSTDRG
ncbi:MAG: DUF3108 domain-containing protein [Ramlibacter sp.]